MHAAAATGHHQSERARGEGDVLRGHRRCNSQSVRSQQIGYQIRFDSSGRGTKLKFVTEGILIKQLQSDALLPHRRALTSRLKQYSCVIMDEVHERHISTDMLLGMLRIIAAQRSDFRIVIMSATMDPQQFIDFFEKPLGDEPTQPMRINVIQVPGRTYPVTSEHSRIRSDFSQLCSCGRE